jgi:copper transport protein
MTLDGYGNLWVADHTINRIAVLDPRTGSSKEISIPTQDPFIQWLTSDSTGNIWFSEQRGNSIASISITAKPAAPLLLQNNSSGNQTTEVGASNGNNAAIGDQLGIQLGVFTIRLGYSDLIFPAVAAGIVVGAFFYSKSIIDLKRSISYVEKRGIK